MESLELGYLNAFYDDEFVSPLNDISSYWTLQNENLDLQLSETLHGILPVSPTEIKSEFDQESEDKFDYHIPDAEYMQGSGEKENWRQDVIYADQFEDHFKQTMATSSYEIISVDPNCGFSSPVTNSENESENSEEYNTDNIIETDERQKKLRYWCNSGTSSRTELSSIEDYISHTSDDDDSDDDDDDDSDMEEVVTENDVTEKSAKEQVNNFLQFDEVDLSKIVKYSDIPSKRRKFDSISSFEEEMGGIFNNFDLATFINKDDFVFNTNTTEYNKKESVLYNSMHTANTEAEIEEDIIVDVETVQDFDDYSLKPTNNIILGVNVQNQEEDDTLKDPSWSPNPKNAKMPRNLKLRNRSNNKVVNVSKVKNLQLAKCKRILEQNPALKTPQNHAIQSKKVGLGKGKQISMSSRPNNSSSDSEDETSDDKANNQKFVNVKSVSRSAEKLTNIEKNIPLKKHSIVKIPKKVIEVKIEGNHIVEVKQEAKNSVINSKACNQGVNTIGKTIKVEPDKQIENQILNSNQIVIDRESSCPETPVIETVAFSVPKKKLNLEEYKRRREKSDCSTNQVGAACSSKFKCIKLEEPKQGECVSEIPIAAIQSRGLLKTEQIKQPNVPQDVKLQRNDELNRSGVKVVNEKADSKTYYDPITEAKNKILRMQKMRRAAQSKKIDLTVSAKVGPVTEILPLEEIVKNCSSRKTANENIVKLNPDHEGITIVSVGCNTDISLAPFQNIEDLIMTNEICKKVDNKSSKLLYNISNTLKKVNSTENALISNNSLIASIKDVVFKKSTLPMLTIQAPPNSANVIVSLPGQLSPRKPEMSQTDHSNSTSSQKNDEKLVHGENKTIMHLDRIRSKTKTISTQTAMLMEFPPLELLMPSTISNSRSRRYRSRQASYSSDEEISTSRSRSRVSSNGSQNSQGTKSRKHRRSRKQSYRSRSRSSSATSCCSDQSSSSSIASSCNRNVSKRSQACSRSPSNSRSFSRNSSTFTEKHECVKRVPPAVQERRIVYVGRIESATDKEDLKRKFSPYGPIREVSIHHKENGMKYGFVTFENAQDAFNTIDSGPRDPKINMYDISFGGRRAFCQTSYADLDNAERNMQPEAPYAPVAKKPTSQNSFEDLLKEVKARIQGSKQKTVRNKM